MYCVLENDRPAAYPTSSYECWHNWKFSEYKQAFEYLKSWVAIYGREVTEKDVPVNTEFEYAPYRFVSIKQINNPH